MAASPMTIQEASSQINFLHTCAEKSSTFSIVVVVVVAVVASLASPFSWVNVLRSGAGSC